MRKYTTRLIIFTLLSIAHYQVLIAQDSLDIKIGQMILIGLPTAKVDAGVLEAVRSGKIGSILLFEKNIPVKNSYLELKKNLLDLSESCHHSAVHCH